MQRRTRENDNLDELCYRTYGNTQSLIDVINANPHAIAHPILPLGLPVEMPEIPEKRPQRGIKLWD